MQTETMRLRELTVRYAVKKDSEGQPIVVGRALSNPRETALSLMTVLQDEPSEVFAILCVTTKHRVIAYHEVSRGTIESTLAHPRLCWAEHKRGYVVATVLWRSGVNARDERASGSTDAT